MDPFKSLNITIILRDEIQATVKQYPKIADDLDSFQCNIADGVSETYWIACSRESDGLAFADAQRQPVIDAPPIDAIDVLLQLITIACKLDARE